jgi:hypothetical protein
MKNAGETLHWSEPISITAGRGGRDTNTLIVRLHAAFCNVKQCSIAKRCLEQADST